MDIDVQPVNIKEAGDVGRVTICIRGHILPAFLSHIDNRMAHSPNTTHQYGKREIIRGINFDKKMWRRKKLQY